jgi:hypothetical protein
MATKRDSKAVGSQVAWGWQLSHRHNSSRRQGRQARCRASTHRMSACGRQRMSLSGLQWPLEVQMSAARVQIAERKRAACQAGSADGAGCTAWGAAAPQVRAHSQLLQPSMARQHQQQPPVSITRGHIRPIKMPACLCCRHILLLEQTRSWMLFTRRTSAGRLRRHVAEAMRSRPITGQAGMAG